MKLSIFRNISRLLAITILFVGFAGYAYLKADWTAAPATPPGSNVAAPINLSATTQVKAAGGVIGATDLLSTRTTASEKIMSPLYCDVNGMKCFSGIQNEIVKLNTPINVPFGTAFNFGSNGLPPNVVNAFIKATAKGSCSGQGCNISTAVAVNYLDLLNNPAVLASTPDSAAVTTYNWVKVINDVSTFTLTIGWPGTASLATGSSVQIMGYECSGNCQ